MFQTCDVIITMSKQLGGIWIDKWPGSPFDQSAPRLGMLRARMEKGFTLKEAHFCPFYNTENYLSCSYQAFNCWVPSFIVTSHNVLCPRNEREENFLG